MKIKSLILCLFFAAKLIAQVEKSNHFNLFSAETDSLRNFNMHFQTTYIYQYKPGFKSEYEGANSLHAATEHQNSLTMTFYAGLRMAKNTSIYINPEIAAGSGLSGALGMAGSTNGETFRVGNPAPALYLARGYLVHTMPIGNEIEYENDDANALGQFQPLNYFRFYIGKYSLGDIFDNNSYGNSPRTQFFNWALMNNGAWDYAANVRGYTNAASIDFKLNNNQFKASIAALPNTANGASLNMDIKKANAINFEYKRSLEINKRKGVLGVLIYRNLAGMGNYNKAIESKDSFLFNSRMAGRKKIGFGINYMQEITNNIGFFARLGWNDGKNETWAFTEIDRTASAGLNLNGKIWKREADELGLAWVINGISKEHSNYLAQGGRGFMLGDGKLNYGNEMIAEFYYNMRPEKQPVWLTADYQYVVNPGYNKDRGPLSVFSLRLHVEL
jgi:high affinity Mn2+ porin